MLAVSTEVTDLLPKAIRVEASVAVWQGAAQILTAPVKSVSFDCNSVTIPSPCTASPA